MPPSSGGIEEGKEAVREPFETVPVHIAVIMDGNGRWAEQKGFSRFKGHEQGVETAEDIVTFCAEQGISYVTLYTFSLDNWKRPKNEITFLMKLLKKFLRTRIDMFTEHNIRFQAIGRIEMLDSSVQKEIAALEKATADFKRMTLCLALSYGGREEIVDAAKEICRRAEKGEMDPEGLTPELFEECMQTSMVPNPDILIRTGSEMRLSNFLLWQVSYTELFFTDTMWPDFSVDEISSIIREYGRRERRFGGV
ncbi:polyprenyl diphosphate synthase [Planctomycetota bacterium]